MVEGSPTLKRYSFNFEGSGLRYLLQEMMIMIHDHRTECSRIFNRGSSKIVELIEELQQKATKQSVVPNQSGCQRIWPV